LERVRVVLAIVAILLVREKLLLVQRSVTRICYEIGSKIENLLERARRHIESTDNTAWNAVEILEMRYRSRELNMTHPFAANLSAGNLYSAAVTDYALIAHTLVLAAMTLPALRRTEDLLAEQAFLLRF